MDSIEAFGAEYLVADAVEMRGKSGVQCYCSKPTFCYCVSGRQIIWISEE